jgi:lipopolysaccharide export system protein LptA
VILRLSAPQALAGVALALGCTFAATAQPAGQTQSTTTMQGLQMNRDQPVRIESASLEVRDKQRQATFTGDVKLTQGETTLKCRVLVVFYEDSAAQKKGGAEAQKSGNSQQIKRAEATGDVFITQKDQTASGESGVFDIKSNSVTLTGNVVVTQGQTVMRGERMVVNLTTGVTKVDSSKGGSGRVEIMLPPGAKQDAKPAPAPAPAAAAPPAKAAPKGPIKIN